MSPNLWPFPSASSGHLRHSNETLTLTGCPEHHSGSFSNRSLKGLARWESFCNLVAVSDQTHSRGDSAPDAALGGAPSVWLLLKRAGTQRRCAPSETPPSLSSSSAHFCTVLSLLAQAPLKRTQTLKALCCQHSSYNLARKELGRPVKPVA